MADDKPQYEGKGIDTDYLRIINNFINKNPVPRPGKPDAQAKPTGVGSLIPPLEESPIFQRESPFLIQRPWKGRYIDASGRDLSYSQPKHERPLRDLIVYSGDQQPLGGTYSKLDTWLKAAASRGYLRLLGQYIRKNIAPSKSADLAAKAHEQMGNEYLQRAARFAGLSGYEDNYRAAMRMAMSEFEGELVQRVRAGILDFLEREYPENAQSIADKTKVSASSQKNW